MRCEEALNYWQQELLGLPVDRAQLEEAYAHIGACQDLCARTLGAAPGIMPLMTPEQRSGQTDLYETLGLSAEEEGDAHALRWRRLRLRAAGRQASQEALDYERAMALASWQAAATHYQEGLRIGKTDLLHEGVARIKQKRLNLAELPSDQPQDSRRPRRERGAKSALTQPPEVSPPTPPAQTLPVWEALPTLVLVAQPGVQRIVVAQRPTDWRVGDPSSGSRLTLRETTPLYASFSRRVGRPEPSPSSGQPQVEGLLGVFALGLWATAITWQWELEVLVRAPSPQHPWSHIALTLEDRRRQDRRTLMEFEQRAPQMTGWWARLREVATGSYQLRFSANDANGDPLEEAMLGLQLTQADEAGT